MGVQCVKSNGVTICWDDGYDAPPEVGGGPRQVGPNPGMIPNQELDTGFHGPIPGQHPTNPPLPDPEGHYFPDHWGQRYSSLTVSPSFSFPNVLFSSILQDKARAVGAFERPVPGAEITLPTFGEELPPRIPGGAAPDERAPEAGPGPNPDVTGDATPILGPLPAQRLISTPWDGLVFSTSLDDLISRPLTPGWDPYLGGGSTLTPRPTPTAAPSEAPSAPPAAPNAAPPAPDDDRTPIAPPWWEVAQPAPYALPHGPAGDPDEQIGTYTMDRVLITSLPDYQIRGRGVQTSRTDTPPTLLRGILAAAGRAGGEPVRVQTIDLSGQTYLRTDQDVAFDFLGIHFVIPPIILETVGFARSTPTAASFRTVAVGAR